MNENERVKMVRNHFSLTMDAFGDRVGLKKSAISLMESGRSAVSNSLRRSVCREFGISEKWLKGEIDSDEIVFERTANDAAAAFAKENGLENIEEVLLREYLQLGDDEKKTFRNYLKNVLRDLYGADQAKAPAADPELTIDQKVARYRAELEAEEAAQMSGASPTGSAEGAVKDA